MPKFPRVLSPALVACVAACLWACGGKEEAPQVAPVTTVDHAGGDPIVERIQKELLDPMAKALAGRRAGSLQDLLTAQSTHFFPIPGSGTRVNPAGLSLRLLEESDNSSMDAEALSRQWFAYFAGWTSSSEGDWQWLSLESDSPEKRGDAGPEATYWIVRTRVQFDGHHETGARHTLQLELSWRVRDVSGEQLIIEELRVLRGLWGLAEQPRYQSLGQWVGFDAALSERNQAGLARKKNRGKLRSVGLTALDWNGDGFQDVILTRHGQHSELYENDGVNGFEPGLLPLQIPRESPGFLVAVDLDGDGLEELIGTRMLSFDGEFGFAGLYTRSHGGFWSLEERALALPIGTGQRQAVIHSITPIDVDQDGLLDLAFAMGGEGPDWDPITQRPNFDLGAKPMRNFLLRNNGNLQFEEVGQALGVTESASTRHLGTMDWNGDGLVDLYECNAAPFADRLLLAGAAGQFAEPLGWSIAAPFEWSDSRAAWALSLPGEVAQSLLVLGHFDPLARIQAEQAQQAGEEVVGTFGGNLWLQPRPTGQADNLASVIGWERGGRAETLVSMDLGNRGAYDLLVAGSEGPGGGVHYFLSAGRASGAMEEVAFLLGLAGLPDIHAAISVDLDGDGDLELALAGDDGSLHLMSDVGESQSFVRLALEPENGPALGASVEVTTKDFVQSKRWQPLIGPSSQQPFDLHVGLGSAEHVDEVLVRWNSGQVTKFKNVPTGGRVTLREADGTFLVEPLPAWPKPLRSDRPLPQVGGYARLLNGKNHALGSKEHANVVHFVSNPDQENPWPWPRAKSLANRGFELSLVVMDSDGWVPAPSEPFVAYTADSVLRSEFLGQDGEVPLPATFVFDSRGRLLRAFSPPPDEATLRSILRLAEGETGYPELLVRLGFEALAERRYKEAEASFTQAISSDPARVDAYVGMGHTLRYLGKLDGAMLAFSNAVRVDPDFSMAHQMLGTLQLSQGQGNKAIASFRRVIDLDGASPRAWFSIGEAASQAQKWEVGLEAFDQALASLEETPSTKAMRADGHCARGKLLQRLKRNKEASDAYKAALSLDPQHPEALDCHHRLLAQMPR